MSHYGPNAFNSEQIPPQAPSNKQGVAAGILQKTAKNLGFQRAGEALCASALGRFTPTQFKYLRAEDSPWTEKALETSEDGLFAYFYYVLHGLAWAAAFVVPFFFLLTMIVFYVIGGGPAQSWQMIKEFFLYAWLPCFLIWLSYKLFAWNILNRNWVLRPRRLFTLSRQSGMLTLYNKKNKVIFSAPFIEFDPWLTTTYDRFGFAHYGLILIHRYHKAHLNLSAFVSATTDDAEIFRMWCMLQRYMDISQPMPDILPLEAVRALDPTTAEYDKTRETPRPERFWRRMSDEDYKTVLHQMRHGYSRRNDFGPPLDIFQGWEPSPNDQ